MNVMKDTMRIAGTEYCGNHTFSNGRIVPIYDVLSLQGLTQTIGYVKFVNSDIDVLYRGECKLHPTLLPSLFRGIKQVGRRTKELNALLHSIGTDKDLRTSLKLDDADVQNQERILEGMLQHYGVPTRYIDLVDNHWVALWMGLYQNRKEKHIPTYCHYVKREIPYSNMIGKGSIDEGKIYQYIILVGVQGNRKKSDDGVELSTDNVLIDLRKALPSIFLRPHAQHGFVLKKQGADSGDSAFYDLAENVIGILKVRIDRADKWLGNGELLTQGNFFPSPIDDLGYSCLLSRSDIFSGSKFEIVKYV